MAKHYILSPCGTSLLTNISDTEKRGLVFRYSNTKNAHDIKFDDLEALKSIVRSAKNQLFDAELEAVRGKSAELNGILGFYHNVITQNSADAHVLVATDTWLGKQVAFIVEEWLKVKGFQQVSVLEVNGLQTASLDDFQAALADLMKQLIPDIEGYSRSEYKVIFNLSGGFKAVQGFLQSIAHFYADETIYIFERSSELLRIPRLPVTLKYDDVIKKHLNFFRNTSRKILVKKPSDISELFILCIDGETELSAWGDLVWSESRKALYSKELLPSPDESRIRYSDKFVTTTKNLSSERLILVNERLDDLNVFLFSRRKINPECLRFQPVKGKSKLPATHEFYAWSDKDAKRVFGHFEGACFVLDELAKGLH